ncbi:hypothetical protein QBC40DRAFT_331942 [Triangularia verruculosa]|uniref:Uncharacterized protein n=1 Tax=Triangularia verruculosa TaxID=2587418 RepID=A0AAN7ASU7_9PEZI|nr:hypothetical protein QBC40DRAFT_331942 [Triangularia verruculosa]
MEDVYQHFGKQSLWDKYDVFKSPSFDVTEIWVDSEGNNKSLVQNRKISSPDVDNWLDEPSRQSFPSLSSVGSRAVRIVWVGQDPIMGGGRSAPSTRVLEHVADSWGLKPAMDYARSSFAGVSACPGRDGSSVFTITYHPKLAVSWTHTTNSAGGPRTQVIIFAEGEERTELSRVLKSTWGATLATDTMFPALLCSLLLAHELDSTLDDIKKVVREVEARTGHHRFTSRRETQPAAGELGQLSAQMSGCAAKLANGTRKLKLVEEINRLISQHTSTSSTTLQHNRPLPPKTASCPSYQYQTGPGQDGTTYLAAASVPWISLLIHRATMQQTDLTYTQSRIDIQIRALFHLIAQQDNAIAFDTASATRSIAASSLQDSSSMKMLALVAMFFLPGSFIAALFSTPLFRWDEAAAAESSNSMTVGTRPQFALFWAVTVPITIAVFIMYGVWMWVVKKKDKRRRKKGLQVLV